MRGIGLGLTVMSLVVSGCGETAPSPETSEAVKVEEAAVPALAQFDPETTITCAYPVKPDDTAESILERFGKDARREEVMGAEGEMFDAVVLWPDDPKSRLEVSFADEAMREVGSLRIAGEEPRWNIAGVTHGTKVAELEQRNGGPFEFYGFGWDYGGIVFDWMGGALGKLDGGCTVGAMIGNWVDTATSPPSELTGDRAVRSDVPSLRVLDVEVLDLWISFP